MPILPPEPDIHPENLLEDDARPGESPDRWWALYTLPRREKDLMRRLRSLGIAHYGPVIKKRNQSPTGRVRVSYVPLFAGYVFLCGDEAARYQAMTTNCISRCLDVDDAEQLFHDLRQIRRLIQSDTPMTPESKLQPGARSGSAAGRWRGWKGR